MNWYGELAWQIHNWVRPDPSHPRLGRWLSGRIVDIVFPIWYEQWRNNL